MEPHEINPQTKLCTIIGTDAQRGERRRIFNRILKEYKCNATAIALNVKAEQLPFMMQHIKNSKVTHMIVEPEFSKILAPWCGNLEPIDYIEIKDGVLKGFSLDSHPLLNGARDREAMKMAIIAHSWFETPLEITFALKDKDNG